MISLTSDAVSEKLWIKFVVSAGWPIVHWVRPLPRETLLIYQCTAL